MKLGRKRGLPIVVEYVQKPGRSKTMGLLIEKRNGNTAYRVMEG